MFEAPEKLVLRRKGGRKEPQENRPRSPRQGDRGGTPRARNSRSPVYAAGSQEDLSGQFYEVTNGKLNFNFGSLHDSKRQLSNSETQGVEYLSAN